MVPGRAARYDDAIRRELHDPMVSNHNESVKRSTNHFHEVQTDFGVGILIPNVGSSVMSV